MSNALDYKEFCTDSSQVDQYLWILDSSLDSRQQKIGYGWLLCWA